MHRVSTPRLRFAVAALASVLVVFAVPGSITQAASTPSYQCGGTNPVYRNLSYSFTERAADLVSCLSLAQEVPQLRTNSAPAIPSLGMQQYWYWSEGQHGVNTLNADTNPGDVTGGVHATSFPTNFATTMTWDPQLTYQETTAISNEVRGFADPSLWGKAQNDLGPSADDYGDFTFWAPTVNMDRDPRWGRTDEAFGEDPYLVGQMAGAFVKGYQGETMAGTPISNYLKVAATAKHYALNNLEDYRQPGGSATNDEDLRDYYTAQFKDLIENAHVNGVMMSYNAINGTPSVADTYTTDELLHRTYGFNGYTTTDCGAVGTTYLGPPSGHDWAPPGWVTDGGGSSAIWTNARNGKEVSGAAGGQAYAVRAGTELNCTGSEYTLPQHPAGDRRRGPGQGSARHRADARADHAHGDRRVRPTLRRAVDAAQGQPDPEPRASGPRPHDRRRRPRPAQERQGISGSKQALLPADPNQLTNVVIVGDLANTVTLGDYSGDPTNFRSTPCRGITQEVKAANPNANVYYDSCNTSTTATTPATCSAQTLNEIKSADLVVVIVGTDVNVASEGTRPLTLAMPGNYDSMISRWRRSAIRECCSPSSPTARYISMTCKSTSRRSCSAATTEKARARRWPT